MVQQPRHGSRRHSTDHRCAHSPFSRHLGLRLLPFIHRSIPPEPHDVGATTPSTGWHVPVREPPRVRQLSFDIPRPRRLHQGRQRASKEAHRSRYTHLPQPPLPILTPPPRPALRFQPIRRPQLKQPNKPKPPAAFPKPIPSTTTDAAPKPPPARATLADWAAPVDDSDYHYEKKKLQRGGRKQKKRKKAADATHQHTETNWDDIYDPARPTNVDEYLRSDERIAELREWKGVLYAHRRRGRESSDDGSDRDEERRDLGGGVGGMTFAPPTSLSFAPPPLSPARAVNADAATGDDAYARRLALSGAAPTPDSSSTISRAPVRYEPPPPAPPPNDDDGMDVDVDPTPEATRRPGQPDFAARLMAKYGWTRGSGLGASSSGITTALRVHVEKPKQHQKGGGRGKIIASRTGQPATTTTEKGKASTVVLLGNMLEGMVDVEGEVEAGLGQEIGEECGERYGRVERVVVDAGGGGVYIKFVEGVSALRVSLPPPFSCC